MQDRYVGDVGDFGKYALLNVLAGDTLRLGVLWYLNRSGEGNRDGLFIDYDDLAPCDPVLFGKLNTLVKTGKRLVTEVERGHILPKSTLFYRAHVPSPARPCYTPQMRARQERLRKSWFLRGCTALRSVNLMFLDPDNGIAGESAAKHHRRSVKYAFLDEISHILSRRQSAIVYQHHQRKKLDQQVSDQLKPFKQCCVNPFALSFHARSVRIYYVLPAKREDSDVLLRRASRFASGPWKPWF